MRDIELAKRTLKDEDLNLVVVNDGRVVFSSESPGVKGLLEAIENFRNLVSGASAADRVIGRGAAFLCAYLNVDRVYGELVSEPAIDVLEKEDVEYSADKVVDNIENRSGSDICPFEKLTEDMKDPEEAYEGIKSLAADIGNL